MGITALKDSNPMGTTVGFFLHEKNSLLDKRRALQNEV
jgi:uncharacterized membrane protein